MSVLCVFQLDESGHRIVAVIRSRQEFLERELFPIEYISIQKIIVHVGGSSLKQKARHATNLLK